jgi:hypothetical protein
MLKNRSFAAIAAIGYLCMAATLVLALVALPGAPPRLVLHWSSARGLDVFGTAREVWNVVAIGSFLAVLSTLVAGALYDRLRIASYIFVYASLWVNILLLVAVAAIMTVN